MISRGCLAMGAGIADGKNKTQDARPIVVIDNYDSFTYNLCQVISCNQNDKGWIDRCRGSCGSRCVFDSARRNVIVLLNCCDSVCLASLEDELSTVIIMG